MKISQVARRYAHALLDLALERKELDFVYNDIQAVRKASAESREFRLMLKTPIVKADKKERIITSIFGSSVRELTLKFLRQLVRKRREAFIPEIAEAFIEQYNEFKNILIVTLKTPVPATDDVRVKVMEIMKKYTQANIQLVEETDPALIGGFTLSWQDKKYDASIDHVVERLRRDVAKVNLYVKEF